MNAGDREPAADALAVPGANVPDLENHLDKYVKPDAGALVFTGIMGVPIRRQNFNKLTTSLEGSGLQGPDLRLGMSGGVLGCP